MFDIRDSSKVPSPGQYEPKHIDHSRSFSMASRMPDLTEKWIRSVPGPGNYEPLELLSKKAKNQVSKFENCPSPRMPHESRKTEAEMKLRIANYPGPGNCKPLC